MGKTVWVAMSGGVDSAVTAALLQRDGYDCVGVTLLLNPWDDPKDARATADRLGIPFVAFEARELFEQRVIRPFVSAYEAGSTPNPCLYCNRALKFGLLYDRAMREGADFLATGHYARIDRSGRRPLLCKSEDGQKDQSYVLYALTRQQLEHVLFPLGELSKQQVREIAEGLALPVAHKQESQDICFIPDGDHTAFLQSFTKKTYPDGEFVTRDGRVLGTHRGIVRYTVGQRKGLGLSLPEPYYVCGKDAVHNRVLLCPGDQLRVAAFTATDFCWTSMDAPTEPLSASVRVRYHQKETQALLTPQSDGSVRIEALPGEHGFVASPGQAAVAYRGDVLLGGGIIA